MALIKLLDCTLRDGGHVNGGKFGKNVIKSIVEKLVLSKVDGTNIKVTIGSEKHDTKLANNIIRSIQNLYNENMYITIKFG